MAILRNFLKALLISNVHKYVINLSHQNATLDNVTRYGSITRSFNFAFVPIEASWRTVVPKRKVHNPIFLTGREEAYMHAMIIGSY